MQHSLNAFGVRLKKQLLAEAVAMVGDADGEKMRDRTRSVWPRSSSPMSGGTARLWEEKARPSLAHLADKFNQAPPPGYVPGRGRGVAGFSAPPPAPAPSHFCLPHAWVS